MRGIFIFTLQFILLIGYSQTPVDCIELNRIPQRSIRHLLKHEEASQIRYLNDFKPSCKNDRDTMGFTIMKNSYLIKDKLDDVWDIYKNTSISKAWNGRLASFGVFFSKWSDQVCYNNDDTAATIDTGQVFFIDLRLMHGLYNLPVGLEVLNIDNLLRTITFSYLEGGKSKGVQTISLFEDESGYTRIIHTSAFKSDSRFRDRHLYPFYHTKILNEFHWNVLKNHLKSPDQFIITP
jgi:hypothetical protein